MACSRVNVTFTFTEGTVEFAVFRLAVMLLRMLAMGASPDSYSEYSQVCFCRLQFSKFQSVQIAHSGWHNLDMPKVLFELFAMLNAARSKNLGVVNFKF
jgi:hypothetical protein